MKTNRKVNLEFSYKRALIRSFLFHVVLILVIVARFAFPSSSSTPMAMTVQTMEDNPEPIQASMVDMRELEAVAKRKEQEKADAIMAAEAEKQRVINEQNRLKAEKEKIELARKADEKRLAEIQQKKKADAEAAKKLAEQKAQKQKADAEAAQKLAAQKALKQAEAAKAKKDAELAKALAAERMPVAEASAMSGDSLRELDRYKLLVQQQIMRNWFVQGAPATGISTLLFVRLSPDGTVLDVKIKRSSGNDALDRSAIAAVLKASPLPVPQEAALSVHFRELNLTLRPDDVVQGG